MFQAYKRPKCSRSYRGRGPAHGSTFKQASARSQSSSMPAISRMKELEKINQFESTFC